MSNPPEPESLDVVLASLRAHLREKLKDAGRPVLVGGWEQIPDHNYPTLNVFCHSGNITRKTAYLYLEKASLTLDLTLRSQSVPTEMTVNKLAKAMIRILHRFQHPLMSGLEVSEWDFDYGKDKQNMFVSQLTLKGSIQLNAAGQSTDAEDVLALITAIDFQVSQKE